MQHSDLIRVRQSPGKGRGVFAIKPIPKGGEEITINYNGDPQEQTRLSFDVR